MTSAANAVMCVSWLYACLSDLSMGGVLDPLSGDHSLLTPEELGRPTGLVSSAPPKCLWGLGQGHYLPERMKQALLGIQEKLDK